MTSTSASSSSTVAPGWKLAFPADEASRAVCFLVEIWKELTTHKPKKFNPKNRENSHTEFLHYYLHMHTKTRGRLTGCWINEEPHIFLDDPDADDPTIIKRIRKDITYFSNASSQCLTLVFEFKKLSPTQRSWKTYIGDDGMGRFVAGEYSKNQPVAIMVGMVIGNRFATIAGLQELLNTTSKVGFLNMVPQLNGVTFSQPSALFPASADFDTEHIRTHDKVPPGGKSIQLSHLFLDMPVV